MRVIDGLLANEQRQASATPSVGVTIAGNIVSDSRARLLSLRHEERPWGGGATIVLDNSDKEIGNRELRGAKVTIGYGYVVGGSGEESNAPPVWVHTQRSISFEGTLAIQLDCIDVWNKLALDIKVGGGVDLKVAGDGEMQDRFEVGMQVVGANSGVMGTVARVVDGSSITVVKIMSTISESGKATQDTFKNGESISVTPIPASGPATITDIDVSSWRGGRGPGWAGSDTILDILKQAASGTASVSLSASDGIINTTKPTFFTNINTTALKIMQDLVARTKTALRVNSSGNIEVLSIKTDPQPIYTYTDSQHAIFQDVHDRRLVLPNRIVVYNSGEVDNLGGTLEHTGVAEDTDAQERYGTSSAPVHVDRLVDMPAQSDKEAEEISGAILRRVQMEAVTGTIVAPMNCAQELFDYVKVIDGRSGLTATGWVGSIVREYKAAEGVYRITLGLGGLSEAVTLPGSQLTPEPPINYPSPSVPTDPILRHRTATYGDMLTLADISFTSQSHNEVSWAPGHILFSDGTTATIIGGTQTMHHDVEYLYWQAGTTNLKMALSLSDVQAWDKVLIAQLIRGDPKLDGSKALVIPHRGLATWDLDMFNDGSGFAKVKKTSIEDGKILLTEAVEVEGSNRLLVSGDQRTGATSAFGFFEGSFTARKVQISTGGVGESSRVELTAKGLEGFSKDVTQFFVSSTDGKAYFGGNSDPLTANISEYGASLDDTGLTFYTGDTLKGIEWQYGEGASAITHIRRGTLDDLYGGNLHLVADFVRLSVNGLHLANQSWIGPITTTGQPRKYLFFRTRSQLYNQSGGHIDTSFAPQDSNQGMLGDELYRWKSTHTQDLFMHDSGWPNFGGIGSGPDAVGNMVYLHTFRTLYSELWADYPNTNYVDVKKFLMMVAKAIAQLDDRLAAVE